MTPSEIVDVLIENDADSPDDLLGRNRDLAIRAAFLNHGWVIRSDGSYGLMSSVTNDVRYIVHIEEHPPGYYHANVSGERLHHHPHRRWVEFDIGSLVLYEPTVSEEEFVNEIEERIVGEYGPDEDQDEYDRNEEGIRADERRDLDQDR